MYHGLHIDLVTPPPLPPPIKKERKKMKKTWETIKKNPTKVIT